MLTFSVRNCLDRYQNLNTLSRYKVFLLLVCVYAFSAESRQSGIVAQYAAQDSLCDLIFCFTQVAFPQRRVANALRKA